MILVPHLSKAVKDVLVFVDTSKLVKKVNTR